MINRLAKTSTLNQQTIQPKKPDTTKTRLSPRHISCFYDLSTRPCEANQSGRGPVRTGLGKLGNRGYH